MSAVSQRVDTVKNGSVDLYPVYVKIDAASNGNNTLVSGVAGYKIRVLCGSMTAANTVTAKFQSAASGTDLTGAISLAVASQHQLAYSPVGHFQTDSGALLNLALSSNVQVSGWLVYVLVPA